MIKTAFFRKRCVRFWVALTVLSSCFAPISWGVADLPDKHPLDESQYRGFVLENGIKVILLSDPKLNKSSASMAVGVGSLSDPEERQGLAHFLEHMLFLGTEKYPEEGEYGQYLRSNGGYSNAYTAGDHTNYHFEIHHDAFEGAIDRFAQFFIAPLFTPEFTEREMNAVHSEHQKNLENDFWRSRQIVRSHYDENHPANQFSTGDLNTLQPVTQEELITFYKEHYSADRMTLSLVGKTSLDQLEALARNYFSSIKNAQLGKIHFSKDFLKSKPAFRLIQVEPIKDLRELSLEFPMPSFSEYYESKPAQLLSFIIGYEGEGSLLSYLKEQGLATGLGAYPYQKTFDFASFNISIELTPKGLKEYPRVIELIFSYVKIMEAAGYPAGLYQERAVMARLEELYSDKGEGTRRAMGLANNLRYYPVDLVERVDYLYTKETPEVYMELLSYIRPDNFIAKLMAKGVKTDQTEPYYGSSYSYTEETGPVYQSFLEPETGIDALYIPPANPFIPTAVKLEAEAPLKLIDEDTLTLYYSQDLEFKRPKATAIFRIRQAKETVDLQTAVLRQFYEACVNEVINEVAYTASSAGLSYGFSASTGQVNLTISGYNESVSKLLEYIVSVMKHFDLEEERFAAIKDRLIRGMENFPKADAWQITRSLKRQVLHEIAYLPSEALPLARDVSLADVLSFAKELFSAGKIEALVHGNVSSNEAESLARFVDENLSMKPVADESLYETLLLNQTLGQSIVSTEKLEVNNSCFWREYFLGIDTPKERAASMIIGNFMAQPFYNEMRTKQQLGYIVFCNTKREKKQLHAYFIIQSSEYPADELQRRVDAFIETIVSRFDELPEEAFERLKAGAYAEVAEKAKSIAEKAGTLFSHAFDHEENWSRRDELLVAISALTREEAKATLSAMFAPDTRRYRTHLAFSRDHEATEVITPTYEVLDDWKAKQVYSND